MKVLAKMATSLRNSFVGGMSLSTISKVVEPHTSSRRLHLRAVADGSSSSTIRSSSDGTVLKPDGEVSKFIGTGIESHGELWWAPLFNVSTEEQWSKLLTSKQVKQQQREAKQGTATISSPGLVPVGSTAIALPDVIDSASNQGTTGSTKAVVFTAEKARALRKKMRASETWHDGWYHSAIATRLAQPSD